MLFALVLRPMTVSDTAAPAPPPKSTLERLNPRAIIQAVHGQPIYTQPTFFFYCARCVRSRFIGLPLAFNRG